MGDNVLPRNTAFTHREYVDKWIALTVAATTAIGYVSSVYWERTVGPRLLLRHEMSLEQEIGKLESMADAVCTTSKLFEHSRLMRSVVVLRHELQQERRRRCRYEYSLENIFSPLSTSTACREGFSLRGQTHGGTSVSGRPTAAAGTAKAGGPATSQPTSVMATGSTTSANVGVSATSNPTSAADNVVAATVSRLDGIKESVYNSLRYNLLAAVKYLLRFGHFFVYLYFFGRRPGLIVMPPSLEDSLHSFLTDVVAPYLIAMTMFGPSILFAPRQMAGADMAASSSSSLDHSDVRLHHRIDHPTPAMSARSGNNYYMFYELDGGQGQYEDGLRTPASINLDRRFADIRICTFNDLVWWFICCFGASYLLVRVVLPRS